MTFRYPAVPISLDGRRAVVINHVEDRRFPEQSDAFYVRALVQLRPRSDPARAKILTTSQLKHFWDAPGQPVRWKLSFDDAFPGLVLLAVGEYLDQHEVPTQPEPGRYSFTAELTTGVFEVLQRRPASNEDITRYLKGKVYWSWRFKLPEAHIGLPDAARLGVAVDDLLHEAYKYQGNLWTQTGDQSFKPTPELIRATDSPSAAPGSPSDDADVTYDVALSFAGEQREYVEEVARALARADIRVFYDGFEDLWGVDLTKHLEDVYRRRSRYIVIFVSKEYIEKAWPNLERQHALARRIERRDDCVLPARFDNLELPGLPATVGYLDIIHMKPRELARRITRKVKDTRR